MADALARRWAGVLRARDLRTLVLAFVVDGSASWSYIVVLTAYVYDRTHSAGWVTAFVSVRWITGMLLGGYAGVLADRYDRRQVLLVSALASAVATFGMVVIVRTDASLYLLLAVSALVSAAAAPIRPASGALIPEVVSESDLVRANSIFALLESIIVVLGPGIGALLLLTGDPVWAVLINVASFLISALLYARLAVRSRGSAEPGGNVFAQWYAGFSTLGQYRTALVLTIFMVLDSAAINTANVLMPPLSEHLGGGDTGFSLLLVANALGGIAAAGVANKLAGSTRMSAVIIGSIFLECVPLWLSALVPNLVSALPLQVLSGAGMVIVDVLAFTSLQRDLPRDVLGRVLGTVDVLMLGSAVLMAVIGSQLYAHLGVGWALAAIGLGFPVLSLLGVSALRRLDRETAARIAELAPRIALLERLELFAGATRGLFEQLAATARPESVPPGTVLIRQGDDADALWILQDGVLAVSAELPDGTSRELPPVAAPGYVGELGLLHGVPRSATVAAETQCHLLRIPGADFTAALETAQPSPAMIGNAGIRMSRTSAPSPQSTQAA